MTWTDIGPTETATALLVDLMIEQDKQRETYERCGGTVTAANKALVIDELFEAWKWMCAKKQLSPDAEPENKFATFVSSPERQAEVAASFNTAFYPAV